MERLQVLIDKLIEQKSKSESPAKMLVTVQLLQNELVKIQQKEQHAGTAKVAVVMPANAVVQSNVEELLPPQVEVKQPEHEIKKDSLAPVAHEAEIKELPTQNTYQTPKPVIHDTIKKDDQREKPYQPKVPAQQPFDAMEETPTLLQQLLPVKEIHEIIGNRNESLNDRLKQERYELAHALKDTPVKDLRKAIGINDRFVFVNELFRGDEAMYERSIKTINSFQILPEAEYWINRELKLKLGWNDNKETVQHFYQLVRRRFS